ncbi:MAG: GNAT family N-acetyltransferase [Verrucomicrobiales bacterium]
MSSRIRITTIDHDSDAYWNALLLRDGILRAPLGLEFSEEDIAAEANDVHIVALEKGEVVGTLLLRSAGEGIVQMRQVAVSQKRQGQGIGKDLVKFAESLAWAECGDEIFLHAREPVVGFYEALGYGGSGEMFLEVGIPHMKMCKRLG